MTFFITKEEYAHYRDMEKIDGLIITNDKNPSILSQKWIGSTSQPDNFGAF